MDTHTHTQNKWTPWGFIRSLSPGGKGELGTRTLSGTSPPCAVTPHFHHHGGTRIHVPKSTGPRPWLLGLNHHEEPPRRTTDEKPPPPQTKSHQDQANCHDDCSTLVLTTTPLFLPGPRDFFPSHSPPDWMRGCRAISGLPSLVGVPRPCSPFAHWLEETFHALPRSGASI